MAGKTVTYATRRGETFSGYLAGADGPGKRPGIVLITAIFGIDAEMRRLADDWARDGFVVSVPDIFWRVMPGPTADLEKARARYQAFDQDQGMEDIEDLIGDIRSRSACNGKVALLGYCFGGLYAHLAAAYLGVDAAGSFHGTKIGHHLDAATRVTCPVSFHFGDRDPVVPLDEVAAIRSAYADHHRALIRLHAGVGHNFSMPDKPGFDPVAAAASRADVLDCFSRL